jgi:hypothetical protein
VITAGKSSIAEVALEGLAAGVLAMMARQLVGARESPATTSPGAHVRLLASVRALVRLQVRALRVHLKQRKMSQLSSTFSLHINVA